MMRSLVYRPDTFSPVLASITLTKLCLFLGCFLIISNKSGLLLVRCTNSNTYKNVKVSISNKELVVVDDVDTILYGYYNEEEEKEQEKIHFLTLSTPINNAINTIHNNTKIVLARSSTSSTTKVKSNLQTQQQQQQRRRRQQQQQRILQWDESYEIDDDKEDDENEDPNHRNRNYRKWMESISLKSDRGNNRQAKARSLTAPACSNSPVPSASYTIIDLLIFVTRRARCEYSNLPSNCTNTAASRQNITKKLCNVIHNETTTILQQSGIINVRFRIVHIKFILNDYYPDPIKKEALRLVESNDATKLRNQSSADLVTIITGGGNVTKSIFNTTTNTTTNITISYPCGIARQNGYTSASSYTCFDSYGIINQLGFNFGCFTNRFNLSSIQVGEHPFAHAYVDPDNRYRTLMAEPCTNTTCPTIPYFSTPDVNATGARIIGTNTTNCAKQIRENVANISNYMKTNLLTCQLQSVGSETKCSDTVNVMHSYINFIIRICRVSCISESKVQSYLQRGYKCGPCP